MVFLKFWGIVGEGIICGVGTLLVEWEKGVWVC